MQWMALLARGFAFWTCESAFWARELTFHSRDIGPNTQELTPNSILETKNLELGLDFGFQVARILVLDRVLWVAIGDRLVFCVVT